MKTLHVICFLFLICIASLGFKLYLIDFDSPPITEDTYGYVLRAFSILNGDLSEHPRKTLGWSILLSPFISGHESNDFLSYLNTARYLSIGISLITIFPMYLLARRFFEQKFSLTAASLFAFEPHLNYNSGFGLSEPIFILLIVLSVYFILQKNINFAYLSFLTVGILWWMRFNGIVTILIISIIFFVVHKISPKLLLRYGICILIFLMVVSPMLIQKNEQFDDPLYFSQTGPFFLGQYSAILAENTQEIEYTAFDYIDEHGITNFLELFVFTGIFNLAVVLYKLLFPFLIVLFPFGVLFSLRSFDQDKNYLKSIWVVVLIILFTFVLYFSVVPEKRLIYHVLPFLIIFSIIPIERVVKYGLNAFSFTQKQRNYFLIGVIGVVIILSGVYTLRYDSPDSTLNQERMQFSEILIENFDGKILDAGDTLRLMKFTKLQNSPHLFKDFQTSRESEFLVQSNDINEITLHASSLDELISIGQEYDLKLISVNQEGVTEIWYPYLDNLYNNDKKYPFLIKVLDTEEIGFQKFKVKVFEINYDKFHSDNP